MGSCLMDFEGGWLLERICRLERKVDLANLATILYMGMLSQEEILITSTEQVYLKCRHKSLLMK